jgi:uncharacterized membrane protein HdeD (DUF308 family)
MVHLDRIERAVLPGSVGHHWWSYLAEGILLVVLGIAAILVPIFASIAFAFFLGIILLVAGAAGAVHALAKPRAPGFGWSLLSAVITIVAGLLLVGFPIHGAFSLTFILAAYLFVEGIASIGYAIKHHEHIDRGWAWMVFNGILDFIMAVVIAWVLPFVFAALWVLGLFISIDLIVGGISLLRMGTAAHDQIPATSTTQLPPQ